MPVPDIPLPLRENHPECLENQSDVVPEGGVVDVLQIELDFLLHYHVDVVILGIIGFLHQLVLVAELYGCRVGYAKECHIGLWLPILIIA